MAEAEVIRFERPNGEGKTLFVSGIPRRMPREEKWASLHSAFSQCGPIYYISLPLSPCNDGIISDTSEATPTDVPSISMETEYAFVTFFSSLAAKSALLNTHRTLHIGRRIIKVELARDRHLPTTVSSLLYIGKCHELCNYYLGFNSWSVSILNMENMEEGERGGRVWEGVRCRVEVTVRGCEGVSCGVGEWRGEEGKAEGGGITDRLRARGTARKIAFRRACEDAFSDILLVLVPGRPASAMIVRRPEDHVRQLMADLISTCPPVNILPCQPDDDNCTEEPQVT